MKYYPELFEYKNRLVLALYESDIIWMSDYSSIDLCHDVYGLEVCGIKDTDTLKRIKRIFKSSFPAWGYSKQWEKKTGRDNGWLLRIHRDPELRNS